MAMRTCLPTCSNLPPPTKSLPDLRGPFAPLQRAERVSAIDVLRGFASMGILVLKINDFGSVELRHAYVRTSKRRSGLGGRLLLPLQALTKR